MRATILPEAIILIKACREVISMVAKGWPRGVLWPEYCLLCHFYYPTIPIFECDFLFALFSDEPEVFLPKYSPTAILHALTSGA